MRLEQDQLEWIVCEVLRRLQAATGAGSTSARVAKPQASGELRLDAHVVSTAQLDGRLDGVARVQVASNALVTPAARDLLSEINIELVRDSA